jgi:hypothetical protein
MPRPNDFLSDKVKFTDFDFGSISSDLSFEDFKENAPSSKSSYGTRLVGYRPGQFVAHLSRMPWGSHAQVV